MLFGSSMAHQTNDTHSIDLGYWQLNTATQTLSSTTESKELEPLLFKALIYFIENQDRIISRQELSENVWQLNFVDDNTINRVIFELRKQLSAEPQLQPLIKTHYRKGYSLSIPKPKSDNTLLENGSNSLKRPSAYWPRPWLYMLVIGVLTFIAIAAYKWKEPTHIAEVQNKTFDSQILSWYRGHHGKLHLSPNQRFLAYNFQADTNEISKMGELRLMDLNTQHEVALNLPSGSTLLGWSANSEWIYYRSPASSKEQGGSCEYRRHPIKQQTSEQDQSLFPCSFGQLKALFDFGKNKLVYSKQAFLGKPNLMAVYTYNLNNKIETRVTTPSQNGFGDQLLAVIPESQQLIFTRDIGDSMELLITSLSGHKTIKLAEFPYLLWAVNWNAKQNTVIWFNHETNEIRRFSMTSYSELPPVPVEVEPSSFVLPMSKDKLLLTTYGYDHDSYVVDLETTKSTFFAKPGVYEVNMAYLGDGVYTYNDIIFRDSASYNVFKIDKNRKYSELKKLGAGYSIIDSDPESAHVLVKNTKDQVSQVRDIDSFAVQLSLPDSGRSGSIRLYDGKVAQLRVNPITDNEAVEVSYLDNTKKLSIEVDNLVSIDWLDDSHLVTISNHRDIALLNIKTAEQTPILTGSQLNELVNNVWLSPTITAYKNKIYLHSRSNVYQLDTQGRLNTVLDIGSAVNSESYIYHIDVHGNKLLVSYVTRYHNEIKLYFAGN